MASQKAGQIPAFCVFRPARSAGSESSTDLRYARAMKIVDVRHPLVKHKLGLMRAAGISNAVRESA